MLEGGGLPITVVSALSVTCKVQELFLQKISTKIHSSSFYLFNCSIVLPEENNFILLLVPILGDNDLTIDIENVISALLVRSNGLSGKNILVIFKGDRHINDEFVSENDPVFLRISYLFRHINNLSISRTKLDYETIDSLAEEVFACKDNFVSDSSPELEEISYILNNKPKWDKNSRCLDFFDTCSGRSMLFRMSIQTLCRVGKLALTLKPKTLVLKNADFSNEKSQILISNSAATTIDLSSNVLKPSNSDFRLKNCKWLSLAANCLDVINLENLPLNLTHLYLHKNSLSEINFDGLGQHSISSLSLYRNNIKSLILPLKKIKYLNIGANPISNVPSLLSDTELCSLGLARTLLTRLPDWIMDSQSLKIIDISYIEHNLPRYQLEHLIAQKKRLITRPGYSL